MALKFRCPGCNKKLAIPESLASRKIRCPACNVAVRTPALPKTDPARPSEAPGEHVLDDDPVEPDRQTVEQPAPADDIAPAMDSQLELPPLPPPVDASSLSGDQPTPPPEQPTDSATDGVTEEDADSQPEVADEFLQSRADGFRLEEALLDADEPAVDDAFAQTRADGFRLEDAVFDDPEPQPEDSDLIGAVVGAATGATQSDTDPAVTRRKLEALRVYDEAIAEPEEDKLVLTSRLQAEEDDLDMTPMVDVTFLLLIFFMITASFTIQKSMPAQPPQSEQKAAAAALEPDDPEEEPVLVEIAADNTVSVEGQKVPLGTPLVEALIRQRTVERRSDVMIELEPEATHGTVVGVTDAAIEAGMESIQRSTR